MIGVEVRAFYIDGHNEGNAKYAAEEIVQDKNMLDQVQLLGYYSVDLN